MSSQTLPYHCSTNSPEGFLFFLPADLGIEGIAKALNSEEIAKWAKETDRPMFVAVGDEYYKLHEETNVMVKNALPMMKESIGKK